MSFTMEGIWSGIIDRDAGGLFPPAPDDGGGADAFLAEYFYLGGWTDAPQPTAIPVPTVTLTPIALP